MINYEVCFYNSDDHQATLGIYTTYEIAESVRKIANDFKGEEYAFIREVEIQNALPVIYTHCAYIGFEDINDVNCYKMDAITIFDIPQYPVKMEPSFNPTLSVITHGTSESDAICKVKMKMVLAIQSGLYQVWKDSIKIKNEVQEKAVAISIEKGAITLDNNGEITYNNFTVWNDTYNTCLQQSGLK